MLSETKNEVPEALRPYLFHRLELDWERRDQAVGDCPFCQKESKFFVSVETGKWDCKRCSLSGNVYTFLRKLWEVSDAATNGQTAVLAKERGLLHAETLTHWGVCKSILSGSWLVPGYNVDGKLCQLYRYATLKTGKKALLATPTLKHQLFGNYSSAKREVWVCEGPWDGMAVWETLKMAKAVNGSMTVTASPSSSLLNSVSVVAVPGCSVFDRSWVRLLKSKAVTLLYDSDHPLPNGDGAGINGMRRVCLIASGEVESLKYLHWGADGYDPSRPSGWDVRDELKAGSTASSRVAALSALMSKLKACPKEWAGEGNAVSSNDLAMKLEPMPCRRWKELVNAWRSAFKWTDGLDVSLSVMLAAASSVRTPGDQLWVKIIGPPSSGKSALCEALSVSKHVLAKSTIRGFHSGFKEGDGNEDCSLIAQISDKALVTKDGDSLLQSPNLGQILSEARDIYDSVSRTHYRNKMGRDYHSIRMSWILCGTESLRRLDSSELGERFLDCVIVDEMGSDVEDEIGWRVAQRAASEMALEVTGQSSVAGDGPDMLAAKRMTGGYLNHLRVNMQEALSGVTEEDAQLRKCQRLAEFISYMRARPSKVQEETVQRELPFRLIYQTIKLAKCLAVVLNRRTLDEEVMRRVAKVCLDTARGRTFNIAERLNRTGDRGAPLRSLALWANQSEDKERLLLRFLKNIGVVEVFKEKGDAVQRWRLTDRFQKLYDEIIEI